MQLLFPRANCPIDRHDVWLNFAWRGCDTADFKTSDESLHVAEQLRWRRGLRPHAMCVNTQTDRALIETL
jgi:hypothetical protein